MGGGASSWRSGLHHPHRRSVSWLKNGHLTQRSHAALSAHRDVDPRQTQHHLFNRFRLTRFGVLFGA